MIFNRVPLGLKPLKPTSAEVLAGRLHMARVAQLPCIICGSRPVHVHHVICGRYGQRRASAFATIPLCSWHHQEGPGSIHQNKRRWVQEHGADHEYLARVADALAGEITP